MKYQYYWLSLRSICREGDGEGGDDGDAAAKAAAAAAAATKTFTQEEVNKLLANEKRAAQKKIQEQLATLENIQRDGLTPEGKQALEQQIETLRAQSQTEVELAKQKAAKQQKEWEKERQKLTEERDAARREHEQLEVDTILTTAMSMHGVRPQAMGIIKPYMVQRMRQVPIMDEEGKATGKTRRVIQIEVPDDEDSSKTKSLQLPPEKAVAHLREQEEFAGLFASAATSGTGSTKTTKTGEPDFRNMTQQEYMEWRKQNLKKG